MNLELTSLENATASLGRSINAAATFEATLPPELNETVRSGIIQNFEVAYELSWKMMKRWIETNISAESVDGGTRRELFRQAAETRLSETLDIGRFHAPNPDCRSPHCVNRLFRTAHQKKRCPSILGAAVYGG
jgi:hypothetical protein